MNELFKNKTNFKDKKEIIIIYNAKKSKDIETNIFGPKFVEHNKDKCKIIFQNQEYDLVSNFKLGSENKIKLKGIKNITDMSYMFYNCYLLVSLPDIDQWNTSKVIDMRSLFLGCESLISLPDISRWDTSKVTNMSYMFSECISLSKLPDIGKWDISSVTDISRIFDDCKSLCFLPDISNWNTKNLKEMVNIFNGCISLSYLPDNSKWNLGKMEYEMKNVYNCINCQRKSLSIFIKNISNNIYNSIINESTLTREIIENIFDDLEEKYKITSFINKYAILRKIIEFEGDKEKIMQWIKYKL